MRNLISPIIIDSVPNFIKTEYPVTTKLLIDYYQWLETNDNFIDVLFNLSNLEVNDINCKYIDAILADLGWTTTKTINFDKRLLVNTLKDFYMSRGSLNGLKYLFRLLFNTDVSITYPRDRWFSLSDSVYYNEIKMVVSSDNYDNPIFQELLYDENLSAYIEGNISGAKSLITKINVINGNYTYIELTINKSEINFVNETVTIFYKDTQFIEQVYERPNLIIRNGGSLYKPGEEIVLTGYNIQGKITVKKIKRSGLTGVDIVNSGFDYAVNELIKTVDTLQGKGFLATISKVDVNGGITEISIINQGTGYTEIPELIVNTLNGTGSILTGLTQDIGKILELQHDSFYWDNIAPPAINIMTVTGTGADLYINNNVYTNISTPKHLDDSKYIGHNCYLHDSNKYNKFSYEVRSVIPYTKSKKHILEHIHPAGVNIFTIQDYYIESEFTILNDDSELVINSFANLLPKIYVGSTANLNDLYVYTFNGNFIGNDGNILLTDLQANHSLDTTIYSSDELIIDNLT